METFPLFLGLLREGCWFPHPLPMDPTLASQGCSSHTRGHHSTTAVSPVMHWGLGDGAGGGGLGGWGYSHWQFSQPSSINYVFNNQKLVVCRGCFTRGRSWRPCLARTSRMSPV